jgi:hypothetical protein
MSWIGGRIASEFLYQEHASARIFRAHRKRQGQIFDMCPPFAV